MTPVYFSCCCCCFFGHGVSQRDSIPPTPLTCTQLGDLIHTVLRRRRDSCSSSSSSSPSVYSGESSLLTEITLGSGNRTLCIPFVILFPPHPSPKVLYQETHQTIQALLKNCFVRGGKKNLFIILQIHLLGKVVCKPPAVRSQTHLCGRLHPCLRQLRPRPASPRSGP